MPAPRMLALACMCSATSRHQRTRCLSRYSPHAERRTDCRRLYEMREAPPCEEDVCLIPATASARVLHQKTREARKPPPAPPATQDEIHSAATAAGIAPFTTFAEIMPARSHVDAPATPRLGQRQPMNMVRRRQHPVQPTDAPDSSHRATTPHHSWHDTCPIIRPPPPENAVRGDDIENRSAHLRE